VLLVKQAQMCLEKQMRINLERSSNFTMGGVDNARDDRKKAMYDCQQSDSTSSAEKSEQQSIQNEMLTKGIP
jgi:hypothetical protein